MENERNNLSRSPRPGDKGKLPMITPEKEIVQWSSGTEVGPLSEFLDSVQFALTGMGRYRQFRHLLYNLRRGREVVRARFDRARIEELLKEHQELLTQFKTLFPEDKVLNHPQRLDNIMTAFDFFRKVKDRFQDDERFNVFNRILNERPIVKSTKNSQELYSKVKDFLINEPDLLQEFVAEFEPSEEAAGS